MKFRLERGMEWKGEFVRKNYIAEIDLWGVDMFGSEMDAGLR